jgi:2-polyprenyl-3-methyl-5-hydroxy-6-metoxy-1,4-benzoquinol methylase
MSESATTWPSQTTSETSDGSNAGYAAFHSPRFTFLVHILRTQLQQESPRVLDVGRSPLTALIAQELGIKVASLGLEPDEETPAGHHYRFDLNETQSRERWRLDLGPYDVVVFAEVLEHLHTAPELVLGYLRELLVPGGILILQTPNAASLRKRVKLALGINPFERLRIDVSNPGHFREYTASELNEILSQSGFRTKHCWRRFYFDARYANHETGREPPSMVKGSVQNLIYRLLPPALREGITVVAVRDR